MIAVLEIIVALPLYEVWLLPFSALSGDSSALGMPPIAVAICIAFLVLPFLALYGVLRNDTVGYVAMGLFPMVAGLGLGVTAVPFVKHLYVFAPQVSSIATLAINFSVVILSVVLYCILKMQTETN